MSTLNFRHRCNVMFNCYLPSLSRLVLNLINFHNMMMSKAWWWWNIFNDARQGWVQVGEIECCSTLHGSSFTFSCSIVCLTYSVPWTLLFAFPKQVAMTMWQSCLKWWRWSDEDCYLNIYQTKLKRCFEGRIASINHKLIHFTKSNNND